MLERDGECGNSRLERDEASDICGGSVPVVIGGDHNVLPVSARGINFHCFVPRLK